MPNLIECLRDIKCNSPCLSTCIQRIVNTLTENSQDVSSGPESMKTMLKVREKANFVKIFSQTIIKTLTNNRKKAYSTIPGSDPSPLILNLEQPMMISNRKENKIRPIIYCIA